MQRVRVVIVSWNSAALLPRCLDHVLATEWDGALDVVVVDNGSTDGTTTGWAERFPVVELRQTGRNLGFAGAMNVGLRDIDGFDAVALVNPDAFVEPTWMQPLADALDDDPGVGAACPKILFAGADPSGQPVINNVGNEIGPTWEPSDRGYGELDRGQYDRAEDVWGWCGAAVLLRRSYLDEVGLFDERLFLYVEDVDLSWRGRRRGWRYRYIPESVVHHEHRASSGGERTPLLDLLNRRNRLVVVTRHGGLVGPTVAWSRALGGLLVSLGRDVVIPAATRGRGDPAGFRRRFRAVVDAVQLLLGRTPSLPGVDGGPSNPAP